MFGSTDLSQINVAYFLTRWITHLCVPTFVFLAETNSILSTTRHNFTIKRLSSYLIRRGMGLIVLELTLARFGWTFNWDYRYAIAQVIWGLGWAMVVLAGLIQLPRTIIALISLILIDGTIYLM